MDVPNAITVREVLSQDLEPLYPLIHSWGGVSAGHISRKEVDGVISGVELSIIGELDWQHVVAEDIAGNILGIMGMCRSDTTIEAALPSGDNTNAAELFSAFVSPTARGQGIGKLLVRHLETKAKQEAYDDIVVASGPRFSETGWPFWQSLYGDPVKVIDGTSIWYKSLAE